LNQLQISEPHFKCREEKTGFYRNRSMQTGSHGTLIGWKSQKQVGGSTLACPITRYMYVFCGEEEPVHFHFYKITWKGGGC